MGLEDNLSNLPARNQSGVYESERRKERQKLHLLTNDAVYFVLIFQPCSLTLFKYVIFINQSVTRDFLKQANNNSVVIWTFLRFMWDNLVRKLLPVLAPWRPFLFGKNGLCMNGKTVIVYYWTCSLRFALLRYWLVLDNPIRFASIMPSFKVNQFVSLCYGIT